MNKADFIRFGIMFADEAVKQITHDLETDPADFKPVSVVLYYRHDTLLAVKVAIKHGMETENGGKIAENGDLLQDNLHTGWNGLYGGHGQVKFMDRVTLRYGRGLPYRVVRNGLKGWYLDAA